MERSCEFCKFQSVGRMEEPCDHCRHNSDDFFEPMTHEDEIKNMQTEELAEWLKECKESCAWNCKYSHTKKCNDDENCIEGITKWLKAEVEE